MGKNKLFNSIALVLVYTIFSLMAFLKNPQPFSPFKNWLSDLGNKVLNPAGAVFYNAGIMLTALLLLLFFSSFSVKNSKKNRVQDLMVSLTQIFGSLGSLCMALSGLYSIDLPGLHSFWSAGLYIGLGTAFAFSVAALRYEADCPKWLLMLGLLTVACDLLTSLLFNTLPIFEWITVALFLSYIASLGAELKDPTHR